MEKNVRSVFSETMAIALSTFDPCLTFYVLSPRMKQKISQNETQGNCKLDLS